MVIRDGYIRLKLTFSHGKLYTNYAKLIFLVKTTVKFGNLSISKILIRINKIYDINRILRYKQNFSNFLQGYVYIFEVDMV